MLEVEIELGDYAAIELEYDDFQLMSEQWFDQPEEVLAEIDDLVVDAPKPWLVRAMFVLGALATVAACIANR